jgi:hypothetical protein
LRKIRNHIVSEWKRILRDAEGKFAGQEPLSIFQLSMIAKSAYLMLLHELVELKGSRLSKDEFNYAIDLFHTIGSSSSDFFIELKRERLCQAVRQEIREMAASEYCENEE